MRLKAGLSVTALKLKPVRMGEGAYWRVTTTS